MDNEKFSIKKFGLSFFQWLPWVKTSRYLIGAGIALIAGLTIYRAYFRKDVQQTQKQRIEQTIKAEPGSQVTINMPDQKQENPKQDKVEPFVFVVGGAHQEKGGEMGWFGGVGAGVKF